MIATFPLGSCSGTSECSSKLLDVCHWAFVVMVFSGSLILRALQSLFLIFVVAGASLVLRVSMKDTCLITSLAQRTTLPDISGRSVTYVFGSLLFITGIRLCLEVAFGTGFPINQLL